MFILTLPCQTRLKFLKRDFLPGSAIIKNIYTFLVSHLCAKDLAMSFFKITQNATVEVSRNSLTFKLVRFSHRECRNFNMTTLDAQDFSSFGILEFFIFPKCQCKLCLCSYQPSGYQPMFCDAADFTTGSMPLYWTLIQLLCNLSRVFSCSLFAIFNYIALSMFSYGPGSHTDKRVPITCLENNFSSPAKDHSRRL